MVFLINETHHPIVFSKPLSMGISYAPSKIHWNYFLAIQQDFEQISRYIEFTKSNNKTFSIELARVIMSSSQEVDVMMKGICKLLGKSNANNIDDYRVCIKSNLKSLVNEEVSIPRFGLKSKPWKNWQGDENPLWWKANNKIKHQRTEHFQQANLKNAINAIGALLIVNIYFYKLDNERQIGSDLTWKDITRELNCGNNFLMLQDSYYGGALLLE